MSYWNHLHHHLDTREIWLAAPEVRARVNSRTSGDPSVWPLDWFAASFAEFLPLARAASIGCGTGALERDLVRRGLVREILGIDASSDALQHARGTASVEGLAIAYLETDAQTFLSQTKDLDAIFFHASLHHFDNPHAILQLCHRALRPGGLLYLDEYIGPSRDEWTLGRLALLNLVYRWLPGDVRRTRVIRAPINREDPTEAAASSRIPHAAESLFRILQRRDYGGQLLSVIYPNLNRESPCMDGSVRLLLDLEDLLLEHSAITRAESYYSIIVGQAGP